MVRRMSFRTPGGERIQAELRRVREDELERTAERYAAEHPDPPPDNPGTRGVLAHVRALLGHRRSARRRTG